MIKKISDLSPLMMDAIGNTLEGLIGQNLKYLVMIIDPNNSDHKIRSNASPDKLREILDQAEVHYEGKRKCIQCESLLPIDYFDGGIDPKKCYLCDELPF